MRKQGSTWQAPSHVLYTPGMQATCLRSPYQLRGARTPGYTGALPAEMLSALPCEQTLRCFSGGDKPQSRSKTGEGGSPLQTGHSEKPPSAPCFCQTQKKPQTWGSSAKRCPAKAGPQALAALLGASANAAHPQRHGSGAPRRPPEVASFGFSSFNASVGHGHGGHTDPTLPVPQPPAHKACTPEAVTAHLNANSEAESCEAFQQ